MNKFWAKIYLWWRRYCPKHGVKKKPWTENDAWPSDSRQYWFKRCEKCDKERRGNIGNKKRQRLERAIEALKPKEEQWQAIE